MVKYSENPKNRMLSVADNNADLEKRLKKLDRFRRVLRKLFKGLSKFFLIEASLIGPVIDVLAVIWFIVCATEDTYYEDAVIILNTGIFLCVFLAACGLSVSKEIMKALSSMFSELSKKYKSYGIDEKYREGNVLLKQLEELNNCYKFETLYMDLREKYPDRQIRFIKRKSEDKRYQAVTIRLEQIYADSDSIVVEENGALCKEYDFLIKKSLFNKIFGEEIDFSVIDEAYSEWHDDFSIWTMEQSEKPEILEL